MSGPLARLMRSSIVHVGFAFLAMGGWAAFANRAHLMPAPLYAGLLQGAISATITLVLKRAIEYLASRFSGLTALLAPPVIAGLVSASLLTILHTLGGTPEILKPSPCRSPSRRATPRSTIIRSGAFGRPEPWRRTRTVAHSPAAIPAGLTPSPAS